MEKSRAILLSLTLILGGCEALAMKAGQALVGAGEKGGIEADAEVTIGKKSEDNDIKTDVKLGNDNRQEASSISNHNNRMPFYTLLLIILLAGWAIPSPEEMWRGIKKGLGR